MFKLIQTGTLEEFIAQLEKLMNEVIGVTESQLLSYFIFGLKPHLSGEMRRAKPSMLLEVIDLAKEFVAILKEIEQNKVVTTRPVQKKTHGNQIFKPNFQITKPVKLVETIKTNNTLIPTYPNTELKETIAFEEIDWKQQ